MTDRELMQQALEALEQSVSTCFDQYSHHEVMSRPEHFMNRAMKALRERLAQPEQEPVAWMFEDDEDNGHKTFQQSPPSPEAVAYLAKWNRPAWVPLYTTPPQRTWVGLSEKEMYKLWLTVDEETDRMAFGKAVEAKLKEKNT